MSPPLKEFSDDTILVDFFLYKLREINVFIFIRNILISPKEKWKKTILFLQSLHDYHMLLGLQGVVVAGRPQ